MEVIFKISKILKIQVTFKGAFIVSMCSLVMGLCSHDSCDININIIWLYDYIRFQFNV